MSQHHIHHHHHHVTPVRSLSPLEVNAYLFVFITFGISWAFNKYIFYLSEWQTFPAPYNLVAAFYFYTLALPYYYAKVIWFHVAVEGFTQYPNLNWVLGVVSIIIYIILLLAILVGAIRLFRKFTGQSGGRFFFYFILPALFALVWFLGKLGITWLFAH